MIRIAIRGTLLVPLIGGVLPAVVRSAPLPSGAAAPPLNLGGSTRQLERSWERLADTKAYQPRLTALLDLAVNLADTP